MDKMCGLAPPSVMSSLLLWDPIGCWDSDDDHAPTRPLLASLYKMHLSLVVVCAVLDMMK